MVGHEYWCASQNQCHEMWWSKYSIHSRLREDPRERNLPYIDRATLADHLLLGSYPANFPLPSRRWLGKVVQDWCQNHQADQVQSSGVISAWFDWSWAGLEWREIVPLYGNTGAEPRVGPLKNHRLPNSDPWNFLSRYSFPGSRPNCYEATVLASSRGEQNDR